MTQRKRLSNTQNCSQNKKPSCSSVSQDDDDDVTFTQPSNTQVQRGLERLTSAQVDQKAAEVVQYFLVKDQKKIPIRRADLVKHVVKEYRNIYPELINRAAQTFDKVFGLKLVEIDNKNHLYILINNLQSAERAELQNCPSPKLGLLFVILSVIFMKGGVVREHVVWNILKKLRVDPGEKHEDFGDVKKVVTEEFVRQKYVEIVRVPHTEPVEHEFKWGQRAEIEVSKVKLLEFMGELHDEDPQVWTQQFRDAHSDRNAAEPSTSQR